LIDCRSGCVNQTGYENQVYQAELALAGPDTAHTPEFNALQRKYVVLGSSSFATPQLFHGVFGISPA
jgi:hypothetical protein